MTLISDDRFSRQSRANSLADMLRRTALRVPEKPAIIYGAETWTYAQLDRHVERIAYALAVSGIARGERVAALSRNNNWYVALRYAVARIGAIFVPVNFMLNEDDVGYILEHSGPRALFVEESCMAVGLAAAARAGTARCYAFPDMRADSPSHVTSLDELLSRAGDGDAPTVPVEGRAIAQIVYTSGTESRPKGAMLSHHAVLWQIQSCIVDCGWTADTVQINAMPLFHCAQLDAFLGPSLQLGGSNIVLRAPTPEAVIPAIEAHRATSFFAPPTVWISLLRSPLFDRHDLSSLRCAYYGASIMPVEVLKELRERLPGLRLWNCYGQTEITRIAAVLKPEDQIRKAGSAGKPVLHVETRVVDEAMRDVAPGEVGEIVHRSPQLLTGYWRDPAKTAEAFSSDWFHSGDLAVVDDEGFMTIVDRKKDMIKSGGENVASREVEEVLYEFPGVSEVAVVGLPDAKWIEIVAAFVVPRAGSALNAAELERHCGARLSRFKIPKRIVLVDALPRNASGKILKRDLRERASAEA